MSMSLTPLPNVTVDEICRDQSTLKDKAALLEKSVNNSFFYSVADSFKAIGAVLLPVALALLVGDLKEVLQPTTEAAKVAFSNATFTTAIAHVSSTAWTLMGAAVASMSLGICSQYIASRHFHNNQFDQFEVNAQHTAKYIAQELQKAPPQVSVVQMQHQYDNPGRKDGQPWVNVVNSNAQGVDNQHSLG